MRRKERAGAGVRKGRPRGRKRMTNVRKGRFKG